MGGKVKFPEEGCFFFFNLQRTHFVTQYTTDTQFIFEYNHTCPFFFSTSGFLQCQCIIIGQQDNQYNSKPRECQNLG